MEMGRDCESHAGSMWVGLAALCVACAAALSGGLGCAGTVQEGPELESGGAGAVPGDMLTVESLELDSECLVLSWCVSICRLRNPTTIAMRPCKVWLTQSCPRCQSPGHQNGRSRVGGGFD